MLLVFKKVDQTPSWKRFPKFFLDVTLILANFLFSSLQYYIQKHFVTPEIKYNENRKME